MSKPRTLLVVLVSLAAVLVATLASAALVAIDPVKVFLTGANPSKSISLRNNGSE